MEWNGSTHGNNMCAQEHNQDTLADEWQVTFNK